MNKQELQSFIDDLVKLRNSLTDEVAFENKSVYPKWREDSEPYVVGQRVVYNDVLYKVLIDHTSQADWTPEVSPSLFAKVLIPDETKIYDWEQPDSTNPYMTGDKVLYEGKTWVSIVDNNVWAPGAYGWEEV